jgi:PleD family two-component response regulator
MPETGQDEGVILADRIRDSLGKAAFEGLTKPVTLSGGVLEYDGQGVTDMIREADERLYRAKKQGRNKIVAG